MCLYCSKMYSLFPQENRILEIWISIWLFFSGENVLSALRFVNKLRLDEFVIVHFWSIVSFDKNVALLLFVICLLLNFWWIVSFRLYFLQSVLYLDTLLLIAIHYVEIPLQHISNHELHRTLIFLYFQLFIHTDLQVVPKIVHELFF